MGQVHSWMCVSPQWRLFAAGAQIVRVKQSLVAAHVHGSVSVHQ